MKVKDLIAILTEEEKKENFIFYKEREEVDALFQLLPLDRPLFDTDKKYSRYSFDLKTLTSKYPPKECFWEASYERFVKPILEGIEFYLNTEILKIVKEQGDSKATYHILLDL